MSRVLRSVGAEAPPLDITPTEEAEPTYQVTEQVEQPPSPVLNPQPKPRPRAPVQVKSGPVTSPAEVQQRAMQPSAAGQIAGLPWWVWALGIYLFTRKKR